MSHISLQQLKNVFFIQITCSAKAVAKVIVPVESFTVLILFLLLLQSEFVNSLLFMPNKIILFFKYKILFHTYRSLTMLFVLFCFPG